MKPPFRLFAAVVTLSSLFIPAPTHAQSDSAVSRLEQATKDNPKDGQAWIRLGRVYRAAGEYRKAEDAYKKATRLVDGAEPWIGLGETYIAWGKNRQAVTTFRRARREDKSSVGAQLGLARALVASGNSEAEKAILEAIEIDTAHVGARLTLAEFYRDTDQRQKMIDAYQAYVDRNPDDVEAVLGLLLGYTLEGRYPLVMAVSSQLYQKSRDYRSLAYLAQALAARGEAEEASRLFNAYLRFLPEAERALYLDLAHVASDAEVAAYAALEPWQQAQFRTDFWRRRDFSLIGGGKAREVEHYRRVWYARVNFADEVEPWDLRGDVYVRYGEPDYRSRSDRENALPPPQVQSVKERIADALYRRGVRYDENLASIVELPELESLDGGSDRALWSGGTGFATTGFDDGQGRSLTTWSNEVIVNGSVYLNQPPDIRAASWIGPVFPVPRSSSGATNVPWESWVYTDIDGGIEIVFVDPYRNGRWEYAEMPELHHAGLVSNALEYQPAPLVQKLEDEMPQYFDVPPGLEPLEFYYDVATFAADSSRTRLEVYFGIPPDQIAFRDQDGRGVADVEHTVVLADGDMQEIARNQEGLTFQLDRSGANVVRSASFIPDAVSLDLTPGDYRLAIQMKDRVSGRWGVYQQKWTIPAYADSLSISDIQVAWQVAAEEGNPRFKKRDVWVTPMPTRSFVKTQKVNMYYEVYNLTRDDFGQTRYTVAYEVRQEVRKSGGLFGAVVKGIGGLFADRKPSTLIEYEATGRDLKEPIFFELDGGKLEVGLNEITVTVTDLTSGRTASRKAIFRLTEPTAERNQFQGEIDREFDEIMQGK